MVALQILESTPSTMDRARANIVEGRTTFDPRGRPQSDGVLTYDQTAGRGQRGRTWYAPPGESLCVTYYFRHGIALPESAGEIAFLAGIAVLDVLHAAIQAAPCLQGHDTVRPRLGLKWPNDILLNDKKLGGILIEMVRAYDGDWCALIGVGLNLHVRDFPPEIASQATSLAREGVASSSPEKTAEEIAKALNGLTEARRKTGFSAILNRWRAWDQTPGRRYQTEIEGKKRAGTAQGVDETGALQLQLDDGRTVVVSSASSVLELMGDEVAGA